MSLCGFHALCQEVIGHFRLFSVGNTPLMGPSTEKGTTIVKGSFIERYS